MRAQSASRRVVAIAAAVWTAVALRAPPAQPAAARTGPAARDWRATRFDTVWTSRGSERGDVLTYPVALTLLGRIAVVLDASNKRIVAFDRASGAVRWTAGPEGRASGGFADPRAVAASGAGTILVTDAKDGVLYEISASGNALKSWRLDALKDVQSLCPLTGRAFIAATSQADATLMYFDLKKRTATSLPFPWPALAGSHMLLRQGTLAVRTGGPCAFTLTVGEGFALLGARGAARVVRYVEPVPLPALVSSRRKGQVKGQDADIVEVHLRQPHLATMSATNNERCAWVLFVGQTPDAGRIIDEYDLQSGRYSASFTLPARVGYVATDGADWFAIGRDHGLPFLQRLRLRAPAGGCLPSARRALPATSEAR